MRTHARRYRSYLLSGNSAYVRTIVTAYTTAHRDVFVPLRFRRLALALPYLRYGVSLPDAHLVGAALHASFAFCEATIPGWIGDPAYALRFRLPPISIRLPPIQELTLEGAIDTLIAQVESAMRTHLKNELDPRSKLYLLQDRRQPGLRDGPLREDHCVTLTKLLLSRRALALEVLRRQDLSVGRRLCAATMEFHKHAPLGCTILALRRMRSFWLG